MLAFNGSFRLLIVLVITACDNHPRFNYLLPDEQTKTKSSRAISSGAGFVNA